MNLVLLKNHLHFNPRSVPFSLIPPISFYLQNSKSTHYNSTPINDNEDGNSKEKLYLCKSKGQHLLTNPRVLDAIVAKSSIKCTDTVLEIGPGTGNLTLRLLQVAKKVIAVEIDKRMVDILSKRVSDHGLQCKLDIISGDALKVNLPDFNIVVANIPYGISSPLVTKLVYGANKFRSLTLLLQKEFAKRLLANPGDSEYNRLAVNVKLVAEVEFVMDVSKRDFVPSPKVDSSVVIIRPKSEVPNVNLDEWWAFARTCFSKKNKTLGAIFKQKKKVMELLRLSKMNGFNKQNDFANVGDDEEEESDNDGSHLCCCSEMELILYKERIVEVLKANGYEGKRPSKMSNEELLNLLSLLNQDGIYFHGQTMGIRADNEAFGAACSPTR